jgi:hypothetical protein
MMTLIRRAGVIAASRIVPADVPTVTVAWVNARRNGEEMEMFDIKLVSAVHIDAIDLFLLAQDDVNGFDKGVLGFGFGDLSRFQLQLGLKPVRKSTTGSIRSEQIGNLYDLPLRRVRRRRLTSRRSLQAIIEVAIVGLAGDRDICAGGATAVEVDLRAYGIGDGRGIQIANEFRTLDAIVGIHSAWVAGEDEFLDSPVVVETERQLRSPCADEGVFVVARKNLPGVCGDGSSNKSVAVVGHDELGDTDKVRPVLGLPGVADTLVDEVSELGESFFRNIVPILPGVLKGVEKDRRKMGGSHQVRKPSAVKIAPLTVVRLTRLVTAISGLRLM